MKKMIFMLFGAVLVLGATTNVSAMTEAELRAKLAKGYTINGAVFKATDAQLVQLDQYLRVNEVSEADANTISQEIDKAVEVIRDSGAKSLSEVKGTYRDKLFAIADEVVDKTDIKKIEYTDGKLYVTDAHDTRFGVDVDPKNPGIKYTDDNSAIVVASVSALAVAVAGLALRKVNA